VLILYVSSIGRTRILSPFQDFEQQTRDDDLQRQEINFIPTSRDSKDGGFDSHYERAHFEWGTSAFLPSIVANADIETRSQKALEFRSLERFFGLHSLVRFLHSDSSTFQPYLQNLRNIRGCSKLQSERSLCETNGISWSRRLISASFSFGPLSLIRSNMPRRFTTRLVPLHPCLTPSLLDWVTLNFPDDTQTLSPLPVSRSLDTRWRSFVLSPLPLYYSAIVLFATISSFLSDLH